MISENTAVDESQIAFFWEHGYLHIPSVFDAAEINELDVHHEALVDDWALRIPGWIGDWRRELMDEETERRSELVALHDLQLYSSAWARAVVHPKLGSAVAALLGGEAEFHHTTLHTKPPEAGMPFPMHQDYAFMPHTDQRYLAALIHLDDTSGANGEIRFLDGSHKLGPLPHITQNADGTPSSPHLALGEYHLEDAVPVPAQRGDVVCFNICTVHGSYLNSTAHPRRLVRAGYRHPDNTQLGGQSTGRPGVMVSGLRRRGPGQDPFPTQ